MFQSARTRIWLPVIAWAAYLAVLLCVALPHGMRTPLSLHTVNAACTPALREVIFPCRAPAPLDASATNADIIRVFKLRDGVMNDQATIAQSARDTVIHGHMPPVPWPPGMLFIEAAFYWLSPAAPVGLLLVVLTCGVWSAVFVGICTVAIQQGAPRAVACILPFALLATSELQLFLGFAVFNTEPLATGMFLLGAGLLTLASLTSSLRQAAAAGVAFALSAYIREQVDIIMLAALALLGVLAAIAWIRRRLVGQRHWLALIAMTLGCYHLATLPYRAINHFHWGDTSNNSMWRLVWQTDQELAPELNFFAWGGGSRGCVVDPVKCAFIHEMRAQHGEDVFSNQDYFRLTVVSYLRHPTGWLMVKLPFLLRGWFTGGAEPWVLAVAAAASAFALCILPAQVAMVSAFLLSAVFVGVLGPLLMTHMEVRYLYLLKMFVVQQALIVAAALPVRRMASRLVAGQPVSPLP